MANRSERTGAWFTESAQYPPTIGVHSANMNMREQKSTKWRERANYAALRLRHICPRGGDMTIYFHEEDLPAGALRDGAIAVDTETMGLRAGRDRLCLVQLSDGRGDQHLVRFGPGSDYAAPNLRAVLSDPNRLKIYHFARFDVAMIAAHMGIDAAPVYCTKIASRLVRTYTDRHGLKELLREVLGVEISKQQQSSDWGAPDISDAQREYAASDVRYLHQLMEKLDIRLEREGRTALAEACFAFLPTRARLDLAGWDEVDIFAHG